MLYNSRNAMNSTKEVKNNMTCTVESDTETSVLLQYICGM